MMPIPTILLIYLPSTAWSQDLSQSLYILAPISKRRDTNFWGIHVDGGDYNGDGRRDVLIGSTGYLSKGSVSAYMFDMDDQTIIDSVATPYDIDAGVNLFGFSFGSDDFNDDGYDDVFVGAGFDSEISDHYNGAAYVVYGSPSGLSSQTKFYSPDKADSGGCGWAADGAGDINGDGFADAVYGCNSGPENTGIAFLIYGSASGLIDSTQQRLQNPLGDQNDEYGYAVSRAGDVNGDGFGDVLVGASDDRWTTGDMQGAAYLYYGSSDGADEDYDRIEPTDTLFGNLGEQVSPAGDLDGDGYDDVLVSDPAANHLVGYGGAVVIRYGAATGMRPEPQLLLPPSARSFDVFGISVAAAGDVDGDGHLDIAVGSAAYDTYDNEGRVYVFFGATSGIGARVSHIGPRDPYYGLGFSWASLAGVGDIDQDGYDDLLVGAKGYGYGEGAAYLVQHGVEDLDGDGTGSPYDCDDTNADVAAPDWYYADNDGDGYGDTSAPIGVGATCPTSSLVSVLKSDCDDTNPAYHPGAEDACGNGLDEDCNGVGTIESDEDDDDLSGVEEEVLGTDLCMWDTDEDGLGDGEEVQKHGTDPLNPDTDGDGLLDGSEVRQYRTDPLNPDTDGDGVSDGAEVAAGTNPLQAPAPEDTAAEESPSESACGCEGRSRSLLFLGGLLLGMGIRRRHQ